MEWWIAGLVLAVTWLALALVHLEQRVAALEGLTGNVLQRAVRNWVTSMSPRGQDIFATVVLFGSFLGMAVSFGLLVATVPFFFYIIHLYLIHTFAMLWLAYSGRDWQEYILSAAVLRSGSLSSFGLGLGGVYLVWIVVMALLYPICRWYQMQKLNDPSKWWLSYL